MYFPSYSRSPSPPAHSPKKFPEKVIISITVHGGMQLIENGRSKSLERVTFNGNSTDSKIIIVNSTSFGVSNYFSNEDAHHCNTTLLKEFEKHLKSKESKTIMKSINDIFLGLFYQSTKRSSSSTTKFAEKTAPLIKEHAKKTFDVFAKFFDDNFTSKKKKITKTNIRKYHKSTKREEIKKKEVDINELTTDTYFERLYMDWFEKSYDVQVIKNTETYIQKYYEVFEEDRNADKSGGHDWNIRVLNSKNSTSLLTDMNIPREIREYGKNREEKAVYSTTLSAVIDYLSMNGAKKIIIFDFSCANIRNTDNKEIKRSREIISIYKRETTKKRKISDEAKTRKKKRSDGGSSSKNRPTIKRLTARNTAKNNKNR
jgi:hypothetical protein